MKGKFFVTSHLFHIYIGLLLACFIGSLLLNISTHLADYWYYIIIPAILIYVFGARKKYQVDARKPSHMPFAPFEIERYLYKEKGDQGMVLIIKLSSIILIVMAGCLSICTSIHYDYTINETVTLFFVTMLLFLYVSGVGFILITGTNICTRHESFKKFNISEEKCCDLCSNVINGDAIKIKWDKKRIKKWDENKEYRHYECFINDKPASIDDF